MTREINFSYILQHFETGRFVEKIFTFQEVHQGLAKATIDTLVRYSLVAVRLGTGLKDRNGKEIFEDDIVYTAEHGNIKAVFPFSEIYDLDEWDDLCAVMGNIYENPELLQ